MGKGLYSYVSPVAAHSRNCGAGLVRSGTIAGMESFEDDGVFWLPDKDAERRTGRLSFDPVEGATLDIMGGFGEIQEQFNDQTRMRRIHGIAGKRYLTLDGCFNTSTNFEAPGVPQQSYYVNRVITDALFDESEDLSFDKCSVTFDQLAHWIGRSGVSVKLQTQTPEPTFPPDRVMIEFEPLRDESAQVADGEELRLTSTWTVGGDNVTKTYLNQGTYLEFVYPGTRPLDGILGDVKCLQDLLTLATNAATAPLEITLWRRDITCEFPPGQQRPQAMKYYAGQLAEGVRLDAPQSAGRILFPFSDIGGLPTIARWVKVARKYQAVVGSLLSIRYASGLYVENRFNNVISAAESFHRLRFSNELSPKDEYKLFVRELVRAVPREHRSWLSNQLQYSNEPRLKNRLSEMVAHAGEAFAALYDDSNAWVTVVTECRNRLTHHDEKRQINFKSGDLYFITESVFTLVMLCLLRECEMDDRALATIAASGSMQFLHSKLNEAVPRLHAQVKNK